MNNAQKLFVIGFAFVLIANAECEGKKEVKTVELENKGTAMKVSTPEWIKNYIANGVSAVQAQHQFKDKYCIIGEQSGANKEFVLTWADSFSAQQRIGEMLRTSIDSTYQGKQRGASQSAGGSTSESAQGESAKEIDILLTKITTITYSGAQREADWWSLLRRYDPDQKNVYNDAYTVYVMYTIPKYTLNSQVASALETAVEKDSELYQLTLEIARDILQNGLSDWGKGK